MQETIELHVDFANGFCLQCTHIYIIYCACMYTSAMYTNCNVHAFIQCSTNLNGNFKLVYMCLIWLLEPEEGKKPKNLQQNPEGLNCQHVRMDVKKPKL